LVIKVGKHVNKHNVETETYFDRAIEGLVPQKFGNPVNFYINYQSKNVFKKSSIKIVFIHRINGKFRKKTFLKNKNFILNFFFTEYSFEGKE